MHDVQFDDDNYDVQWVSGRKDRNPGLRKMTPAERPQSDRSRKIARNKARNGKEFCRQVGE